METESETEKREKRFDSAIATCLSSQKKFEENVPDAVMKDGFVSMVENGNEHQLVLMGMALRAHAARARRQLVIAFSGAALAAAGARHISNRLADEKPAEPAVVQEAPRLWIK